jgi:hypothetical protein
MALMEAGGMLALCMDYFFSTMIVAIVESVAFVAVFSQWW